MKDDNPDSKKMKAAYQMANTLLRDRLVKEDAENIKILDTMDDADVVVVDGTYDHIHLVLDSMRIPYLRSSQEQFLQLSLNPEQTVFINCASTFPVEGARKLAGFVVEGGQAVTTDWALKNVLETGFPGYVKYNGRPTGDEVVRVEVASKKDSVVKGFLDEESGPVWWLEGSSYPIEILDKKKVDVLIKSKELKKKYGEDPVIIRFNHGKGTVYHMISHFYLQRTETRGAKKSATVYAKQKGASKTTMQDWAAGAEDIDYSTVQSASTSAEFVTRTILQQKKKHKK